MYISIDSSIRTIFDGRNFLVIVTEDLVAALIQLLDVMFWSRWAVSMVRIWRIPQVPPAPSSRSNWGDGKQGCTECTGGGVEIQIYLYVHRLWALAGLEEHVVCFSFVLSTWAQNENGRTCHNCWTMHGCLLLRRRAKVRKETCSRPNKSCQLLTNLLCTRKDHAIYAFYSIQSACNVQTPDTRLPDELLNE